MVTNAVDILMKMAEQLNDEEQIELLRRLEALRQPRQRPTKTLRVFHVDHFPDTLTLRREDEYGDDDR